MQATSCWFSGRIGRDAVAGKGCQPTAHDRPLAQALNEQVAALEEQLAAGFAAHPDAAIVRSQPGLGVVLGARVLAEFGDDPARYQTAKGRKAFAGTAPVTRSSGLRTVVVARAACNQPLADACYLWGSRP